MKSLARLLKKLKINIKEWRKASKDLKDIELNEAKAEVESIEKVGENRRLTVNEKERRLQGKWKIRKYEMKKINDLKQKAKLKWAKVGDENSKFFHGIINSRKARNRINTRVIDGKVEDDPKVIKNEMKMNFKTRFTEPLQRRPSLDGRGFRRLTDEQAK